MLDRSADAVRTAVAEHGTEWQERAQADLDQARTELADALDLVERRLRERKEADLIVDFLNGRVPRWLPSEPGRYQQLDELRKLAVAPPQRAR